MQLAVVFSCLVVFWCHLQENVRARVLCNNGQIKCVDNATCTMGQCLCLPDFKGDGRVFCARDRCVTTGRGDTIYTLFDLHAPLQQLMLKVNLPCSVDLVRPPVSGGFLSTAGNCFITSITANSMVRPGTSLHDPAFRTFITSLHFKGFFPGVSISVYLSADNCTVIPSTLGTVQNVKFETALTTEVLKKLYIPSCDLHIGFSALYGEVFVSLPKTLATGSILRGLGGNCNNMTDIETVGTAGQQVAYFLRYLADNARQAGRFAVQCRKFADRTRVMTDCTDAELLNSGDICGRLLGKFGRCLLNNGIRNETGLMHLFGTCVVNGCDGQTRTQLCTLVQSAEVSPTCVLGTCS